MNISLLNKNAVICGSTQGIGLASAKILAGLGASCTLIARNENSLLKAIQELPSPTGQAHHIAIADFDHPDQLEHAIQAITAAYPVHILVNNSGGPQPGPILDAEVADFEKAFRQHLICNQLLAKHVIPGMKKAGYGRIINIVSTSVKTPLGNLGVSNTIRAAVAGWAKTLSNEVGIHQITVNNVLPGLTATARYTKLLTHIANGKQIEETEAEKEILETIPMGRIGLPEEIGNLIAFLASPAASYINGTSIPVDGGKTPAF